MNTLEKEFVPFQEALELKELGFDEPCLVSWNFYTRDLNYNGSPSTFSSEDVVQLPTFSQAFRFFREKYILFSHPHRAIDSNGVWYYFRVETKRTDVCFGSFLYEEAELACLRKLIEIAKTK